MPLVRNLGFSSLSQPKSSPRIPLRPFAYLTHRSAEPRVVRALPNLHHPVAELRLLLAPVKQVHRPATVASTVLSSPYRGPAAARRCHIEGMEKKNSSAGALVAGSGPRCCPAQRLQFQSPWRREASTPAQYSSSLSGRSRAAASARITREPIQTCFYPCTTSLPRRATPREEGARGLLL